MQYLLNDNSLRVFSGRWGAKRGTRDILEFAWRHPRRANGIGIYFEAPTEWHESRDLLFVLDLWLVAFYIHLPWWGRIYPDHSQCCGPRIGFRFFEEYLWIYHGQDTGNSRDKRATTTITMPWAWRFCKHEVLNAAGEWEQFIGSWEQDKGADGRVQEVHDYRYVLNSGEVQQRKATIFIERRIWTRRWWWPRRLERRSIDVCFDGEVGERTGSWKGGTVGCGYDLLPFESAVDCLRRMQAERKFKARSG